MTSVFFPQYKKQAMRIFLLFGILLIQTMTFAQEEDAWVYFTDKENVEASINNPLSILTQRAIDRKNKDGIAIDSRDVPVNESYISQIKTVAEITVFAKSKWFNSVYVRGTETDINALRDNFDFVDNIEFADKNLNFAGRTEASDNKFLIEDTTISFTYGTTANQIEMINADVLHLADFTGEGILVAVMDSGFPNVDTMGAFQRLRDNNDLLGGYDFVDRTENVYEFSGGDHGTRVLSDMAGFIEDQFVGTAPDASYYVFRTEDVASETPVEEAYWVEATERADSLGVDLINTSLGYKDDFDETRYDHDIEDLDGNTTFITRGANIANEKGILVVTSAGNSGASGVGAPADGTGVFSIGAVNADGNYVGFSSQGSDFQATQKPDVVAQGAGSAVVNSLNEIVNNNGTSFSSPIMAGGIASLMQALPNASNEEIKQYVRRSASQFETPDYFLGFGIPNLENALAIGLSVKEQQFNSFNIFPNPAESVLTIQMPTFDEPSQLIIIDILGKTVLNRFLINSTTKIDVSSFSSGLYFLNFQSSASKQTFKFIKQ